MQGGHDCPASRSKNAEKLAADNTFAPVLMKLCRHAKKGSIRNELDVQILISMLQTKDYSLTSATAKTTVHQF